VTPTPTATPTGIGAIVDYSARGYFTANPRTFHDGMPSASYVPLPPGMTHAELAQLQQDCIDRINLYRSGALKFTGGTSDPGVPKPPLTHLMGNNSCSSASALGDLYVNGGGGGCAGAHTNAFSCPGGNSGQNSCCLRSGATYAAVRAQLFSCLQQMWDEGIGLPDNAPFTSSNGHWHNMRRATNLYAQCGFAFTANGRVWMNQDFMWGPGQVPLTCSCEGRNPGDPDGCGGLCVTN
jgi:hypothetical protein